MPSHNPCSASYRRWHHIFQASLVLLGIPNGALLQSIEASHSQLAISLCSSWSICSRGCTTNTDQGFLCNVAKKCAQSYCSVILSHNVADIGMPHASHLVAQGVDMWDKLLTFFSTFIPFVSPCPFLLPALRSHQRLSNKVCMPISSSIILMLIIVCHTDGLSCAKWSSQFSSHARPWWQWQISQLWGDYWKFCMFWTWGMKLCFFYNSSCWSFLVTTTSLSGQISAHCQWFCQFLAPKQLPVQ